MIEETLEEAILRIKSENEHYIDEVAFELGAKWQQEQEKITTDDAYNEGFENGKHWQQERSYSKEEVKNIISKLIRDCYYMQEPNQDVTEWFEQFKK